MSTAKVWAALVEAGPSVDPFQICLKSHEQSARSRARLRTGL